MAGIRKTRAQHEASGAVAKNPARFANDPHTPPAPKAAIGKAPRHLEAAQQKVWREIVSNLPEGLLGSCDAIIVELAVRLVIKMRTLPEKWTSTDAGQLANIMGKLGGTPGDRLRLNVTTPSAPTKEESAFAALDD
jgi:hypothetical protein